MPLSNYLIQSRCGPSYSITSGKVVDIHPTNDATLVDSIWDWMASVGWIVLTFGHAPESLG